MSGPTVLEAHLALLRIVMFGTEEENRELQEASAKRKTAPKEPAKP